MSSYSSLTHLSRSHEISHLPEMPVDKAQEEAVEIPAVTDDQELPRGAHFGNVLHELLELIPFADIGQGRVDSELRDRLSQRYGLELVNPQRLDQLLQRVVTTPLIADDNQLTLARLDAENTLMEMPFYISMQLFNTEEINHILKDDRAVGRLHGIELEGYLTGFIDLIFEYQGRYYLLDYKSNYLNSYQHADLERAMHDHNYGLQYWIYTVVLHRYLNGRLANYNYAEHFGGVLYLFARGMEPSQSGSGVYYARPDEALLKELDRVLGGVQ